jgi:hypothetical protein
MRILAIAPRSPDARFDASPLPFGDVRCRTWRLLDATPFNATSVPTIRNARFLPRPASPPLATGAYPLSGGTGHRAGPREGRLTRVADRARSV